MVRLITSHGRPLPCPPRRRLPSPAADDGMGHAGHVERRPPVAVPVGGELAVPLTLHAGGDGADAAPGIKVSWSAWKRRVLRRGAELTKPSARMSRPRASSTPQPIRSPDLVLPSVLPMEGVDMTSGSSGPRGCSPLCVLCCWPIEPWHAIAQQGGSLVHAVCVDEPAEPVHSHLRKPGARADRRASEVPRSVVSA
jgi:hypothetical protein